MRHIYPLIGLSLMLFIGACSDTEAKSGPPASTDETESNAEWSEFDENESSEKEDGDDDDKDDTGKEDECICGADVIDGAACEGTYETTMCVDAEGTWWWCEDGAWTADKEE